MTPAAGGKITFKSSNINRKTNDVAAEIGADGSYTIKALIGENQIRVSPPRTRRRRRRVAGCTASMCSRSSVETTRMT